MGRPKGRKDSKPRQRKNTEPEISRQHVPWTKQTKEKATKVLRERVVLQKTTFFEVVIRSNGDTRRHYFDEAGNEYVNILELENLRKKEHFESQLANPIAEGGENT